MNAPLACLKNKDTNNAKSKVRFKQLIPDLQSAIRGAFTTDSSTPTWRTNLIIEHPIFTIDDLKKNVANLKIAGM
jgi:hypothetical protein